MECKKSSCFVFTFIILSLALLTSSTEGAEPVKYLIVLSDQGLESAAANTELIESAGGEVVGGRFEIGVVRAVSSDPEFASRLRQTPGVQGVNRDVRRETNITHALKSLKAAQAPILKRSGRASDILSRSRDIGNTSGPVEVTDPTQADFYPLQWNFPIMQAEEAWAAASNLGDPNVVVAVVDSGIDYLHEELVGKVDLERSRSFTSAEDEVVAELYPGIEPFVDINFHGTFMAGQIACNASGTTCLAPNVTLVSVKVVDFVAMGEIGEIVDGLMYAADLPADVIGMVFAFNFTRPDDNPSITALRRAIRYAERQGSVVFAEASIFEATELVPVDADQNGNDVIVPAEAGAIVVGATGPEDEFSNFNNFGASLLDISAPGGRPPGESDPPDAITVTFGPCTGFTVHDFIESCVRVVPEDTAWVALAGTIPATGLAAGLAALYDSQFGGEKTGAQICRQMFRTADDVEAPGFDNLTGHGRINALRMLTE